MKNRITFARLREWSLHMLFALLSGVITSVLLLGALLIGLSSMASALALMAQPVAEATEIGPAIYFGAFSVLLASFLATAPIKGWWYNFLLRMFHLDTPLEETPS